MEDLRKRLYERDFGEVQNKRHGLTSTQVDVSRGWGDIKTPIGAPAPVVVPERVAVPAAAPEMAAYEALTPPVEAIEEPVKKKRSYRMIIVLACVGLFVVAALVSSAFLFLGTNQISARNISISLTAPFSVAAGEKLGIQVSVANQNTIQIEAATLILNYPSGTKTADEEARDLYEERVPIEVLAPGQALNIPVNVILFGEENEEKEIKAVIEYRVAGSNGTFFKDADPIKVKINSSPLVVRVDAIEKVSSGQEIEIKITLQSNASVVQRNILVEAAFPNSFTFLKADPQPAYGQNVWLVSEILPETSQTITLRGRVQGVAKEQAQVQIAVGAPRSDNQFIMGSVLSKADTNYEIERPFIDVLVDINQDTDGEAIVDAGLDSNVAVRVKNTLDETIYDMRVEVSPNGNLIRDNQLNVPSGFYDTGSKTIRYEVSGMPSLAEVRPGETRDFLFTVRPDINQNTASFSISTNVYARRVGEVNAAEEIVGTALAEAKYSSTILIDSQAGRNDGPFTDTGAVPPVANAETTYTLTFAAAAGVNDLTGAVMTTTLPQYVTWLNKYDGEGTVEYNPVAKQLRWNIGTLAAKTAKQLQVQVSLLPSVTQVGTTPALVGIQEFRATDRFTEVGLRTSRLPVSTELSTEAGYDKENGVVESAR